MNDDGIQVFGRAMRDIKTESPPLTEDAQEALFCISSDFPRHLSLYPYIAAECPPGELAHDIWHITRVYKWALRLSSEAAADPDLAGAAALVHDLVPIPKDSPDRALGGEQSALAAQPLLSKVGYNADEVGVIIAAVQTSSWSRGLAPTNAVGVVLQDADRLDAIGAVGIMRCIATAQHMSKPHRLGRFYHPSDPGAQTSRVLDDRRQALDHFSAKLLTLAEGMHLQTASIEAAQRHACMVRFMETVAEEVQ